MQRGKELEMQRAVKAGLSLCVQIQQLVSPFEDRGRSTRTSYKLASQYGVFNIVSRGGRG